MDLIDVTSLRFPKGICRFQLDNLLVFQAARLAIIDFLSFFADAEFERKITKDRERRKLHPK